MARHVVFGTGQVGRLVVQQLLDAGCDVMAVNRHGNGAIAGAQVVAGDAADPGFTTRVAAGSDVVYFCLNATNYGCWPEEFPPLQDAVLAGAEASGARLVVLDNLYTYGPTDGGDLVETLPAHPCSAKAATRAAMTDQLLAAHHAGRLPVAIGRASDYFGPGVRQSALGERVFGHALTGRAAQVMGDPAQLHSYSYTPDVAAALIKLGTDPIAPGSVWHLPIAETRTTRQIIERVYSLAGHRPRTVAAGRTTLRLLGCVKPAMREYRHTLYQFTQRWVVDDDRYRHAFGDHTTPLDDALGNTLDWYRLGSTATVAPADVDALTNRGSR
jgi:nucleoside-diphosphate-sugar epimerase